MKTPKSLKIPSRGITPSQNAGKVIKNTKSRHSLPDTGKLLYSKISPERKKKSMTPEMKFGVGIKALEENVSHSSKKVAKTPAQGGANKSFKISSLKNKSHTPSIEKTKKGSSDSPLGFGEMEGGDNTLVSEEIIEKQHNFPKMANANKTINSSTGKNGKRQMKGFEKHSTLTQDTTGNQKKRKSKKKSFKLENCNTLSFSFGPDGQISEESDMKSEDDAQNSFLDTNKKLKLEACHTPRLLSEHDEQTSEESDMMSEDDIQNSSLHTESEGETEKKPNKQENKSQEILTSQENNIGFWNSDSINVTEDYIDRDLVLAAVKALMKLHRVKSDSDKVSLDSDLHVQIIVEPKIMPRNSKLFIEIPLLHPINSDSANTCLFVKDLKENTSEDTEKKYKILLKKYNILNNIEVMSWSRVEKEYSEFNLRSGLINKYDKFFVDDRITSRSLSFFRNHNFVSRKFPISVSLIENTVENFRKARCMCASSFWTASMNVPFFYFEVGSTDLSEEQITDNILKLASGLDKEFPEGWKNIKSFSFNITKKTFFPISSSLCANVTLYSTKNEKKRKSQQEEDSDDEQLLMEEKFRRESKKKIKLERDEEIKEGSDVEEMEGDIDVKEDMEGDSDVDEETEGDSDVDEETEGDSEENGEEESIDDNSQGNSSLDSDENGNEDNMEEEEGFVGSGAGDKENGDAEIESSSSQDSSDKEPDVEVAEKEYLKKWRPSPIKEMRKENRKQFFSKRIVK